MFEALEELFYPVFSVSTALLAIATAYLAKKAMDRGLTYSTFVVTVWTLSILAVARIWHSIYEIFALEQSYGEIVEIIEYALFISAYIVFIWIVLKTLAIKVPSSEKKQ